MKKYELCINNFKTFLDILQFFFERLLTQLCKEHYIVLFWFFFLNNFYRDFELPSFNFGKVHNQNYSPDLNISKNYTGCRD